jgi:transmembrane sensor
MKSDQYISAHAKKMVGEPLDAQDQLSWEEREPNRVMSGDFDHYDEPVRAHGRFEKDTDRAYTVFRDLVFAGAPGIPVVKINRGRFLKPVLWAAVAAVIILVGAGGMQYFWPKFFEEKISLPVADLHQGRQKSDSTVFIVLTDKTRIPIAENKTGFVVKQGPASVTVPSPGALMYSPESDETRGEELYNIMQVPEGKQFEVLLPDGSKVWLNAASSIRFPVVFGKKERHVELSGEGYFEISKDKSRPFFVHVGKATTEVLGTKFNVNSYDSRKETIITLIEGSVQVGVKQNKVRLQPSQQVTVKDSLLGKVVAADLEEALAWKNRMFHYTHEELFVIMDELARYYRVSSVKYEGQYEHTKFVLRSVPRSWPLERVLSLLEKTGDVRFKLEGNKITILR